MSTTSNVTKVEYYEFLGVSRDCNDQELKTAYRRLAMQYHPDRNPDNPAAEEKFKQASEAYQVLSDPQKRAAYDRYGHAGVSGTGGQFTGLSVNKCGNRRLRGMLVELAWLLPRYQPDYKRLARWKWVFEPKGKAPPAMKKKAAVALARQLAVDLWRLRTGRAKPEDLGLTLVA